MKGSFAYIEERLPQSIPKLRIKKMFGLKRKTPDSIRPEYLRKQLQVIEETDNPVVRDDAVIRLASHLGELSVLGNQRTTDLVSGEGRSLDEAEAQEVVRQVREMLGG